MMRSTLDGPHELITAGLTLIRLVVFYLYSLVLIDLKQVFGQRTSRNYDINKCKYSINPKVIIHSSDQA
jgi:hypothetical protein